MTAAELADAIYAYLRPLRGQGLDAIAREIQHGADALMVIAAVGPQRADDMQRDINRCGTPRAIPTQAPVGGTWHVSPEAGLPPANCAASPSRGAAPSSRRGRPRTYDWDIVLDAWQAHPSMREVERRTGVPRGSVGAILHYARQRGDKRAIWVRSRDDA